MYQHRDHRDEASDGQAEPGHRERQATQAKQGQEEEALTSLLLPLWNDQFEVCGLVLRDGSLYAIKNVHEEPVHNFKFCMDDLDRFSNQYTYEDVVGVYHTHPNNNPRPSQRDVEGWPKGHRLRYWIVTRDWVTEWRKSDLGTTLILTSGPSLDPSVHPPTAGV